MGLLATPDDAQGDTPIRPITKVLNLYAGIGGNRKLWENVEVTAVENEPHIAEAYQKLFPEDTVIIGDAHQFILDHCNEYDLIWSSPPCPTHSKMNLALQGWGVKRYPDMTLYQEIVYLKQFYKGLWVVENVESYYDPLILPQIIDRHYFWSNFYIPRTDTGRGFNVTRALDGELQTYYGIELPPGTKGRRKLMRNAVDPRLGLHILNAALRSQSRAEGNDLVAMDFGPELDVSNPHPSTNSKDKE